MLWGEGKCHHPSNMAMVAPQQSYAARVRGRGEAEIDQDDFVAQVSGTRSYDRSQLDGYSGQELDQLERLYGVRLRGQMRAFLHAMGRCSGGLFGDDPLIFYRAAWSVRTQIVHQVVLFGDMQDAGEFDLLAAKPFWFSQESETQHFFVLTAAEDPDQVWQFDENAALARATGLSLLTYLQNLSAWEEQHPPAVDVLCRGELLKV